MYGTQTGKHIKCIPSTQLATEQGAGSWKLQTHKLRVRRMEGRERKRRKKRKRGGKRRKKRKRGRKSEGEIEGGRKKLKRRVI